MTDDSAGRKILVTGAASGIGRELVLTLAAAGDRVAGVDRDGGGLAGLPLTHAIAADLADGAAATAAVQEAVTALGGLDAVVNAAGVEGRGTVEETSLEEWDRVFATNARAPFVVGRAALPALRAAGGGTIVNVASQLALVAAPSTAAYCSSKAAVLHLTRAMALDAAADGITVNAVCPGPTQTPMLDRYFAASADAEAERKAFLATIPTGRMVMPEEIVGAIVYLLSPSARSTTGAEIVVDGGFVIH